MKRKITLLLAIVVLGYSSSSAQYSASISHTADELLAELAGDGVTVLNPVLTCRDSFSAIFSGTGGLDFHNGIVLSTFATPKVFDSFDFYDYGYLLGTSSADMYNPITANDRAMNDLLDYYDYTLSEAYNTCAIDFDLIPQAKTLQMDFAFASNTDGDMAYCEPHSDLLAVLIQGGTEYIDTTNLAVFPDTEIPVSSWTLKADSILIAGVKSAPSSCEFILGEELMPFDAYKIDNAWGGYTGTIHYPLMSTQIPITAAVSPCDTYHVKIAIADVRMWDVYWSTMPTTLFLKSGSLRTTGQPEDCPTTVDPEPPSSLSEYLKQQSEIKVSPNPFNNGMAIAIQNDNGKELYEVGLYDIGGRLLNQSKGNLNEVNTSLAAIGNNLATGIYMLKIKSASGKYNHTIKVVKE